MIGEIKTDDIYEYFFDKNTKLNEELRNTVVGCIDGINIFIRDIDNEDPFYNSYEKLFEIYEPYFVSLVEITSDENLSRHFKEDKEMLEKFSEALGTLVRDLINVQDEYTKSKYKEITSFL